MAFGMFLVFGFARGDPDEFGTLEREAGDHGHADERRQAADEGRFVERAVGEADAGVYAHDAEDHGQASGMMKTMTVTTLISANQYLLSPNPLTEKAFSPNMMARNSALQITPGTSGNQNCMTRLAATSSTAMVTAQLNQ